MRGFDTDVFVLGGGPAGLAAAIAAAQMGLRVMLADAAHPPIDKACGEGLMPDSLLALRQLGVVLPPGCGGSFRGIRFRSSDHCVPADFPNGPGLAVRRTLLHELLVQRAKERGVELLWGCPVTRVEGHTVSAGKQPVTAYWIVGADGSQSSVRRWAGLESFRRNTQRFSYRRHYRRRPWSDYVEVFWGERCQFYLSPVNPDEIGLALLTRDPRCRIEDALPHFPELHRRLGGVATSSAERGAIAPTRRLVRVTRENVALIGDASGTVDPITGEGMCLAFKQALALAEALAAGDLNLYEQAHCRLARRPRFMADFMLLMDRSSFLRKRSMVAFESHPGLFANLLAMHVGELTTVRFATTAAVLGWQVITG